MILRGARSTSARMTPLFIGLSIKTPTGVICGYRFARSHLRHLAAKPSKKVDPKLIDEVCRMVEMQKLLPALTSPWEDIERRDELLEQCEGAIYNLL